MKAKYPSCCARTPGCYVRPGDEVSIVCDVPPEHAPRTRYGHSHPSDCHVKATTTTTSPTQPRMGLRRPSEDDLAEGRKRFEGFVPSTYQAALRDALSGDRRHVVVEAVAGSGKSTTLLWLLNTLDLGRTLYLAFNKAIVEEFSDRIPDWSVCQTLNSAGNALVREHGVRIDPNHGCSDLYRSLYDVGPKAPTQRTSEHERNRELEGPTLKLVSLARGSLVTPTVSALGPLAEQHEVAGWESDPAEVAARVAAVLNALRSAYMSARAARGTLKGDYDCQVWLPSEFNLRPAKTFDTVLVDETQDLNAAQVDLALRLAGRDGRIVAVGDPRQAIYAFRGAGTRSMADLTDTLAGTARGVRTLPLGICYRCPTLVLDLVREAGFHTSIQPRPDAPRGEVSVSTVDKLLDLVQAEQPQDTLVLSPLNAPLFPALLSLVRNGIPAGIQGRDAGGPLKALWGACKSKATKRFRSESFDAIVRMVEEDMDREQRKAEEAEEDVEAATDRHATLLILCREVEDEQGLHKLLDDLFVGPEGASRVLFSTVHRAKGLQRKQVLVLRPDAIPFPWARQQWAAEQAINLAYVAYTRPTHRLVLVASDQGIHARTEDALARLGLLPQQPPPDGPPGGDGMVEGYEDYEAQVEDYEAREREAIEAEHVEDMEAYHHAEAREAIEREAIEAEPEREVRHPKGLPVPPQSKGSGDYTPPTHEDWETIRAAYEREGWHALLIRPKGWYQQALIVSDGNGTTVRCSTTLDVRDGRERRKGANAIDVVRIRDMYTPHGVPVGGARKVLRTEGWQGRVVERVNKLIGEEHK